MTRTRGDLILYRSSGHWYERLITLATKGPFVHVGIVVDPYTVIAARTSGIAYEKAPLDDDMHTTIPIAPRGNSTITITGTNAKGATITETIPMPARATQSGIEQGLAWAIKQVGDEYGWSDIFYQGLKYLWPRNPLRFYIAGKMDCSDFATRYLLQAGVVLPPEFDDPTTITPCDLARWAGVLRGAHS